MTDRIKGFTDIGIKDPNLSTTVQNKNWITVTKLVNVDPLVRRPY